MSIPPNSENQKPADMWTPQFEDALSTVRRTSRDSRIVIFALLSFTLANLVFLFNGCDKGWTKSRIEKVRKALIADCRGNLNDETPKIGMEAKVYELENTIERTMLDCIELYGQSKEPKQTQTGETPMPKEGANAASLDSTTGRLFLNCVELYVQSNELINARLDESNSSSEEVKPSTSENAMDRMLMNCIDLYVQSFQMKDPPNQELVKPHERSQSLTSEDITPRMFVACAELYSQTKKLKQIRHDQITKPKENASAWTSDYSKDRAYLNCAELYAHFKALKRMYNNDIMFIRIPIVGMRVDANWLAIFSSIGLLILLGSLIVTFRREKQALSFASHEEILKRACAESFFPRWASLLIIWLPVIVEIVVLVDDFMTVMLGRDINLALSLCTNIFATVLTLFCIAFAIWATVELNALDSKRKS